VNQLVNQRELQTHSGNLLEGRTTEYRL